MRSRDAYSPQYSGFRGVVRGVWFSPGRFFSQLDPGVGPVGPALFAAAILFINLLADTVLQALWTRSFSIALIYTPLVGLVVSVVIAPLLIAGYAALALVVLEGFPSVRGFGRLFGAFGYATAAGIILWVPYGPLVAIPYFCYAATVATRQTLGLDWRKAAAAALVPVGALLVVLVVLLGPSDMWRALINPPGA